METRLAPLSDFCITNFLQHVVVAVQLVPVWQKLRECRNSVCRKVWIQSLIANLYKKQCPNVSASTRENYAFRCNFGYTSNNNVFCLELANTL